MQTRRRNPAVNLGYTPDMFDQALIILEEKVMEMAGKDLKQLDLPTPQRSLSDRLSREMFRETS
jgi:hypothetical protein